ncbi:MAG: glucosidase [Armatimonadaceae bacterium]
MPENAEAQRLNEDAKREKNWKRWGPYLAERQWGTVREDYSADGSAWAYFPHDHARSRAYRWGEDGLLGITDRECRLCFAWAFWNEKDPFLKERLFGLSGNEGNHGEDVKEMYFYLDALPTYSYVQALYKYPQAAFPYEELRQENRRRGKQQGEYEITDTGIFDDGRYFDIFVEYAKNSPNDILIRLTAHNRGPDPAPLHLLPTLWLRNVWSWGCEHEGCGPRVPIHPIPESEFPGLRLEHDTLGNFRLYLDLSPDDAQDALLFTENETNFARLHDYENGAECVKDGFHEFVVHGKRDAIKRQEPGTKAAWHLRREVAPGESVTLRLRLAEEQELSPSAQPFGDAFDEIFAARIAETQAFYGKRPVDLSLCDGKDNLKNARRVQRHAYAGLLHTKQFYHYSVRHWLSGDPAFPPPPHGHQKVRNTDWKHLFNRDVISMPDKWEFPWYASWDLAFHMLPMARIDPEYAKEQLILFLREWYMHPNGQLPAYEWALDDVNPPVHAWACWRVYDVTGRTDKIFLARTFQKLLLNFTWWVNRKDTEGHNVFGGGFLGMDNIGVFDRSQPLPPGHRLDQADGTAWMAFYCVTMLIMALELATEMPEYEDVASKFFEHYVAIVDAMTTLGGSGLWHDEDGFYYDQLHVEGEQKTLRVRSLVGVVPLFAVQILDQRVLDQLPGFTKRMNWFLEHRKDLAQYTSYCESGGADNDGIGKRLLALPSEERLRRVLSYVLSESEMLSPYGVRSLSKIHEKHPFRLDGFSDAATEVRYEPAESTSDLFGGNSNWRGPIWLPLNILLIEALQRYHRFYGDDFTIECPIGSGKAMNLRDVSDELSRRLIRLFLPGDDGIAPWQGTDPRWRDDPHWRDLTLFYEHFHGDTGRGLGASHQTGWTALIAPLIENIRLE